MQLPHLFFWHASYGYAGTLNDKNVLHLSPLLERLIDGYFEKVEENYSKRWITEEHFQFRNKKAITLSHTN